VIRKELVLGEPHQDCTEGERQGGRECKTAPLTASPTIPIA
jgi:hypothetical protein